MLCLAQVALTPLACASFSIPMICSSLNLLFISFCSFYLSRTTLFNCPLFGDQARASPKKPDHREYFLQYIGHESRRSYCDCTCEQPHPTLIRCILIP